MPTPSRRIIELPSEVEAVFREFRTCEMSTLARDGSPITWPTLPFWRTEEGRFLITTSIGLPHKAFNVRRNGRVSLLFSDSTASGLKDPPAVLVQGDAEAPDEVSTSDGSSMILCDGVDTIGPLLHHLTAAARRTDASPFGPGDTSHPASDIVSTFKPIQPKPATNSTPATTPA